MQTHGGSSSARDSTCTTKATHSMHQSCCHPVASRNEGTKVEPMQGSARLANPPAEHPEMTTSVAAPRPRTFSKSSCIAFSTCLPRYQTLASGRDGAGVDVALDPENEPPSQYRKNTGWCGR